MSKPTWRKTSGCSATSAFFVLMLYFGADSRTDVAPVTVVASLNIRACDCANNQETNLMSLSEGLALDPGIEEQTAKFEVGEVIITPAASAALEASGQTLAELLARHRAGDWGDVADHVARFDERAWSSSSICRVSMPSDMASG